MDLGNKIFKAFFNKNNILKLIRGWKTIWHFENNLSRRYFYRNFKVTVKLMRSQTFHGSCSAL